jgi:hypothetical protein
MSTELRRSRSNDVPEEVEVLQWRLEQFEVLGFGELDALALSHSDADLAEARRLRKTQCPRHLVLRILL